jgi:myo-inositol-1(or 4)-monophosphatase
MPSPAPGSAAPNGPAVPNGPAAPGPAAQGPAAPGPAARFDAGALVRLGHDVADAVAAALAPVGDWAPAGRRPGQYAIDLVADDAALAVLDRPGVGVLSEESGLHRPGSPVMAVVDPVDGSTNAAHRVPWYATSVCFVDAEGPLAAVVVNHGTGDRYDAVRGGGARRDGAPVAPSGVGTLGKAVVALSGFPSRHLGWAQFRAFGAAALDLCSVADGRVDAFAVCGGSHLAPWDYLGGLLVCREAGASVVGLGPGDLVALQPDARRGLVAAATSAVADAVLVALGQPVPARGS